LGQKEIERLINKLKFDKQILVERKTDGEDDSE
jgi:hypothetical protein